MKQLIFVTSNDGKAREAAAVLGTTIKRVKLNLDELQSVDLRAIVEHKVRGAYAQLKQPVIAEDVSFAIKQLNGLPGPLIKWFEEGIGSQGVADMLSKPDRSVRWIVAYGFFDGKTFFYAEGVTDGTVAKKVKGSEGFGFDTIFIPKGYTKTTAQLGVAEKIKFGSRTKALLKLKKILNART